VEKRCENLMLINLALSDIALGLRLERLIGSDHLTV